ncbi:unnamed protein product [Bursaphelenchus okinawaensis]|uniref:Uncharacterized protein n=1 Tax=Bursaphelenchus okinawaensis TaxID=465554 RepID=A0A811KCP7_9BILA|nr:unnamed protein product [Bursaphelenchus okinawaensis]CAG9101058.1 unnamed protein product [Bursaphelenchus okinawaensis]
MDENRPEMGLKTVDSTKKPLFDKFWKRKNNDYSAIKGDEKPKKVSFFKLWRFASRSDLILVAIGSTVSIITGLGIPCLALLIGSMSEAFVNATTEFMAISNNMKDRSFIVNFTKTEEFKEVTSKRIWMSIYLGIALFLSAAIQVNCFLTACENMMGRIRRRFFYSILRQDMEWYDRHHTGTLATKLFDDLERMREGTGDKVALAIQYSAQFCGGFIVAFAVDWKLTLIMMSLVPLLVIIGIFIAFLMARASTNEARIYAEAGTVAEEVFSAIRTVYAFNGQESECQRYEKELKRARWSGKLRSIYVGVGFGLLFIVLMASYCLSFWVGTDMVVDQGMKPGVMITVFFAVMMGSMALARAAPQFAVIGTAQGTAASIYAIIDRQNQIEQQKALQASVLPVTSGHVHISHVTFSYPSRPEIKILDDFDLTIKPGEVVALVGSSGCGKSTLCSLLLRYYDVDHGDISIDNTVIRDMDVKKLRKIIGIVSQEPVLFNISIKDNISVGCHDDGHDDVVYNGGNGTIVQADEDGVSGNYCDEKLLDSDVKYGQNLKVEEKLGNFEVDEISNFKDDKSYKTESENLVNKDDSQDIEARCHQKSSDSDVKHDSYIKKSQLDLTKNLQNQVMDNIEAVKTACKSANASQFVEALPSRYDTCVGESGVQLSGGQKQRVAIARALIRRPKILLLDESTSALDAESEFKVQKALETAAKGRTTLIIAHRLSTVKIADRIVAMDKGKVAESGSHDELMEKKALHQGIEQPSTMGNVDDMTKKLDPMSIEPTTISEGNEAVRTSESVAKPQEPKTELERLQKELAEEKAVPKSLLSILRYAKPEWVMLTLGTLICIVEGCFFPMFSVFFSNILEVFAGTDPNEKRRKGHIWALSCLLLGLFYAISIFCHSTLFGFSAERLTMRLRSKLFRRILSQELSYFDEPTHTTGRLCTRLSTDAPNVKSAIDFRLGSVFSNIVSFVCGIVLAFYYNWAMAILMTFIFPFGAVGHFFHLRYIRGHAKDDDNEWENVGKVAIEAVENIRTVRALVLEDYFYQTFCDHLERPIKTLRIRARFQALTYGFGSSIFYFLQAASFAFGVYLILNRNEDPMSVLRCLFAISFTAGSLGHLSAYFPEYAKARMAAGIIFKMLNDKPKVNNMARNGIKLDSIQGTITLSNVNFAYPQRSQTQIFNNLNLKVPAGTTLALVGASGCGKSTIFSLIERFYNCNDGEITVDGLKINSVEPQRLREIMALVPQEPVLFDRSIRDNILYGTGGTVEKWAKEERAAGGLDKSGVGSTGHNNKTTVSQPANEDRIEAQENLEANKSNIEHIQHQHGTEIEVDSQRPTDLMDNIEKPDNSETYSNLDKPINSIVKNNLNNNKNVNLHTLPTYDDNNTPLLLKGTNSESLSQNIKNSTKKSTKNDKIGTEASDESLDDILKMVNMYDVIQSLPDRLSTRVGDKGTQLSGGQKQRVAIARALVKNPKILLLDEATSALDSESEYILQQAIHRATQGRTCITIAHRLSTIMNADNIAVIKDGTVIEYGNHQELMNKKGAYYELVEKQTI